MGETVEKSIVATAITTTTRSQLPSWQTVITVEMIGARWPP